MLSLFICTNPRQFTVSSDILLSMIKNRITSVILVVIFVGTNKDISQELKKCFKDEKDKETSH